MSGSGTSLGRLRPFLLPSACIVLDFGFWAQGERERHPGWAMAAAPSTLLIAFRDALVGKRFHLLRLPRLYRHWVFSLTVDLMAGKVYRALCQGSVYQLP
jgi:hypothetical protein